MRLSLLRAPKGPDPNADIGEHQFAYAIMPHCARWQDASVVAEALKFNVPIVWASGNFNHEKIKCFAQVDDANLVLDTIKKAEDSDALIIRLYECHGAHGLAKLKIGIPITSAHLCNILEENTDAVKISEGVIHVPYRPFEIITFKLA